jgi:hypothetical protein
MENRGHVPRSQSAGRLSLNDPSWARTTRVVFDHPCLSLHCTCSRPKLPIVLTALSLLATTNFRHGIKVYEEGMAQHLDVTIISDHSSYWRFILVTDHCTDKRYHNSSLRN